ncbi:MAG: hypothetical protein K0S42_2055 [Microvirga sp.]|nr:hypothetical protein [Microvirga sp.]
MVCSFCTSHNEQLNKVLNRDKKERRKGNGRNGARNEEKTEDRHTPPCTVSIMEALHLKSRT